ncbi:MAG TPA: sugar phosphate isomerase/epimerase [Verrucomicrobiae bacterium]|nr:sugar phosphate isomerase/epimerase [Verrucomicrobiae bacterium]
MRFGINTFLFTSPFTNRSTRLFGTFRRWGFDSVEIAVEDPADIDPARIKAELDRHQLVAGTLCACFPPARDLRGTARQQRECQRYLRALLRLMPALNCRTLIGPLYSATGRAEMVPPAQRRAQWRLVVRQLREICDVAGDAGVSIAMEPLNRFETDFLNTVEQGLALIAEVNRPALKLLLDTFHMNIEEKDIPAAIRRAGRHVAHFHACGSDRGTPGRDHLDWPGIRAALHDIGYAGDVVIESFTPDVKVIARAAAIWRRIEPTREEIARQGLHFLRENLK